MSAQIITAFVFGVAFVIALIVLAIAFPRPTSFQYTVFRIVLSLAAAGTAAMIPGFITLDISAENALLLRVRGAIAVFAVVFFFNPAQLAVQSESQEQVKSDPEHVNPKSRESAPLDTETQSGFKGIIESSNPGPSDLEISFPLIRTATNCFYEKMNSNASEKVVLASWDKQVIPFMPVGFGGELKDSYDLGFFATPRRNGNNEEFSDPVFDLVIRNDSQKNVVLSNVGVRINAKLSAPLAGPYEPVSIRIPFDDINIDTRGMGKGDTNFVSFEPAVLPPGATHGLRVRLDNWHNLLLHVIQFLFEVDNVTVATPEIFLRF